MPGEKDLHKLLRAMSPKLEDDEYVFCTLRDASYGDFIEAKPLASFTEDEGLTLILKKESADRFGLRYEGVFKCITLMVHSSLEAVGLTAAISGKLCEHNISANVVAAYYHDHVFIPSYSAPKALKLLLELCC